MLKTLLHYIPFVWIGMVYIQPYSVLSHFSWDVIEVTLVTLVTKQYFHHFKSIFSLHSKIINGTENFSKPWIAWFLTKDKGYPLLTPPPPLFKKKQLKFHFLCMTYVYNMQLLMLCSLYVSLTHFYKHPMISMTC